MTKFLAWIEAVYDKHGPLVALVIGLAIVGTLVAIAYALGVGTSDLVRWLERF